MASLPIIKYRVHDLSPSRHSCVENHTPKTEATDAIYAQDATMPQTPKNDNVEAQVSVCSRGVGLGAFVTHSGRCLLATTVRDPVDLGCGRA